MCGSSLEEEPEAADASEAAPARSRLGTWITTLLVAGAVLVVLGAGGVGLYAVLQREPQVEAPTELPTVTPTATESPTPTQLPTSTSTPTPVPPRSHQVQPGEALLSIADEYDVSIEEIMALNPELDPELLVVGDVVLVPPDPELSAVEDSVQQTVEAGGVVIHVVQEGETLSEIAEEYGVSMDVIRVANDLQAGDDTIQANQSLQIPSSTAVPSPTPTPDPDATATPKSPYRAPVPLYPPDGAGIVAGEGPLVLEWTSVSVLGDDEWYAVRLFQPPGGTVSVTHHTRASSWRVPAAILLAAPNGMREFVWQVRVVRSDTGGLSGPLVHAGEPSPAQSFGWAAPTSTPGPTSLPE
jgi:LysM repeat protein